MNTGQDPYWLQNVRKIHPFKFFMWITILGIGIMFTFLVVGFVATNNIKNYYLPKYFNLSTIVVLLSSFSMNKTLTAFRKDDIKKLHTNLIISFLLAQVFIYSQLKGWQELYLHGYFLSGSVNGSYLYLLSGLHLLHFLGGMIFLIIIYKKVYQSFRDPFKNLIFITDPYEELKLDLLHFYWHFMGALWLIMYCVFLLFVI